MEVTMDTNPSLSLPPQPYPPSPHAQPPSESRKRSIHDLTDASHQEDGRPSPHYTAETENQENTAPAVTPGDADAPEPLAASMISKPTNPNTDTNTPMADPASKETTVTLAESTLNTVPVGAAGPAAKKRKLSPASREAKQQEKEAKEKARLEERAKKEEERRAREEEKRKREAEREEEKKKREEKRKAREEEKAAKEEEKRKKEAAKEEERRKKEEDRLKKERVSLTGCGWGFVRRGEKLTDGCRLNPNLMRSLRSPRFPCKRPARVSMCRRRRAPRAPRDSRCKRPRLCRTMSVSSRSFFSSRILGWRRRIDLSAMRKLFVI